MTLPSAAVIDTCFRSQTYLSLLIFSWYKLIYNYEYHNSIESFAPDGLIKW